MNTFARLPAFARAHKLWLLLFCIGMIRLVSLSFYPLFDTTEARYGEIARIMVETGNWITPQIDYDIPFWGKPPLSFWASAVSIKVFTNSEFFLRLPHFLAALAVLVMIWKFILAVNFSRRQADIAVAVVASTIGFLIVAGTVMTDMYLCLAMTMTMTGFWRGWHGEKSQIYVMYAGLGIGLLAKGPVLIVLAGIVLFPWLAINYGLAGMWRPVWQRLNLLTGLLLTLCIAAPWYWLAERATPGFFEYFILGEHFQRFVDSGWRGDLYGAGHAQTRGMIWLYWLIVTLPWSPILLIAGVRTLLRAPLQMLRDPLILFALLWMCSPMLLFSLAGNILPAYIIPGLPAIGLLMIKAADSFRDFKGRYLLLVGPALLIILCGYAALIATDQRSDKGLLSRGVDSNDALYYLGKRPYSAQYYSNGQALQTENVPDEERYYLVIRKRNKRHNLDSQCELRSQNRARKLFFCEPGRAG